MSIVLLMWRRLVIIRFRYNWNQLCRWIVKIINHHRLIRGWDCLSLSSTVLDIW